VSLTLVRLSVAVPVLVKATAFAALSEPTFWFPNATLVADSLTTGAVPVPVSEIACGEPLALSVILSAAVAAPTVFGSKYSVNAQEALIATLVPQLSLMRNDKAFVPVSLALLILSTPVPVLVKVTVLAGPLVLMF